MTKQMDTIKKDFDERRTKYNQNKVELDKKAFAGLNSIGPMRNCRPTRLQRPRDDVDRSSSDVGTSRHDLD